MASCLSLGLYLGLGLGPGLCLQPGLDPVVLPLGPEDQPQVTRMGHHHPLGHPAQPIVQGPVPARGLVTDGKRMAQLFENLDHFLPRPSHLLLLDPLAVLVENTHRRRPLVNIQTDRPYGRPSCLDLGLGDRAHAARSEYPEPIRKEACFIV